MFRKVFHPGINMSNKTEFANLTKDLISVILDTFDYQTANVLEKASKDHYTKTVPSGWVMHKEYTDPTQDVHYGVCIKAPISDAPTKFKYFCIYLKDNGNMVYTSAGEMPPTEGTIEQQYCCSNSYVNSYALQLNYGGAFDIFIQSGPNHILISTSYNGGSGTATYRFGMFTLTERTRVQPWDTASSNHVPVVLGKHGHSKTAPNFLNVISRLPIQGTMIEYIGFREIYTSANDIDTRILVDGEYKIFFYVPTYALQETVYGEQHPSINVYFVGSKNSTGMIENNIPSSTSESLVIIGGIEYMVLRTRYSYGEILYIKLE